MEARSLKVLEHPLAVETGSCSDILVNGVPVVTEAGTLAELVTELGHGDSRVATARNGDFVPERVRRTTQLAPGDRIEIVSPRHGG
jgi:sulfur carrier protein